MSAGGQVVETESTTSYTEHIIRSERGKMLRLRTTQRIWAALTIALLAWDIVPVDAATAGFP